MKSSFSLIWICLFGLSPIGLYAQTKVSLNWDEQIDHEQNRLDLLDGKKDSCTPVNTYAQRIRSKNIYFKCIDRIQQNLLLVQMEPKAKLAFQNKLLQDIQGLGEDNTRYLSYFEQYFWLIEELSKQKSEVSHLILLKNHVSLGLDALSYIVDRPFAEGFLYFATSIAPYDVLTHYIEYNDKPYMLKILEAVAKNDPNAVKQYFGTIHPVNNILKTSKDPVVVKLYEIYASLKSAGQAYTNLELIVEEGMSIGQAELVTKDPNKWFSALTKIRCKSQILGSYSVDRELEVMSLQRIRKINLLHDEKDAIRFASAESWSAQELFTCMVYSQDEIFTSTFLGLFNRMMAKRADSSMMLFFNKLGYNKFRTFIKMCAGYNTLQRVMNTLNTQEKSELIDKMLIGLDETGGNLSPAVEVADFYGSLEDEGLKQVTLKKLEELLKSNVREYDAFGIRVYGLLFKLAGGSPEAIAGIGYSFDIPALLMVEKELLFPDKKHIQQHIFYDDEDGESSFNSFVAQFKNNKNYQFTDKGNYVVVESTTGNKLLLYINKPQKDEIAFEELRLLFETNKRFPDLVVHRGHSYHLTGTINQLTNNTKVAILGSCGGYGNITRVLDAATDAQIVSSKQIGTWTVNNVLLMDLCEMLRTNGNLDWQELWKGLDKKLSTNNKWKDYIPPYKNLGVKFVKAYQQI